MADDITPEEEQQQEPTSHTEGAKPEDEKLGEPGLKALSSEREARKNAERELADLRTKLQEFEDRDKTEAQKAADRLQKAEEDAAYWRTSYQTGEARRAIEKAAGTAGAIDGEVVYLYLKERGAIQHDKDGKPVGVEQAIKALAADKPALFKTTPDGMRDAASTGTASTSNRRIDDIIRGR